MLFNLGKAPANSENTINAQVTVAVGGTGGTGGNAAAVTAKNGFDGSIDTFGQTSPGVFAQSVGGGGGDGGAASGYTLAITGACSLSGAKSFSYNCRQSNGTGSNTTYSANVNVGGNGEVGGDGGVASVTNDGSISTAGTASHAVSAQSVGGGGGTGGAASTGIGAFTSNKIAADVAKVLADATKLDPYSALASWTSFSLSLGGQGGAGGKGEATTVENGGVISTAGEASYGIMAQSVGGGGGSGGAASSAPTHSLSIGGSGSGGGDGGAVKVIGDAGSTVTTDADASLGILAQSVGGGGGESGNKKSLVVNPQLAIALGGKDGVSGNGGDVTVTDTETAITTKGRAATAIFAQSIGGGGGLALDKLAGAEGTLSAAGSGSASGIGGRVEVTHSGKIRTAIDAAESGSTAAHGIFAQSVGGGGGYTGSVVMGSPANFSNNLPIGPDGDTSTNTSGDGGLVTVIASGDITTNGGSSVGIFAQSVGGGGGVVGNPDLTDAAGARIGNAGGSGKGGTVTVTYGAAASNGLKTSGAGAHGIFAQSVGGPGTTLENTDSLVQDAVGAGFGNTQDPVVSVVANADVTVTGSGAYGIFAQSAGDGMGAISVAVGAEATVTGGMPDGSDAGGSAIYIKDGTGAAVTNDGSIVSGGGIDGTAIYADDASVDVVNNGSITGQFVKSAMAETDRQMTVTNHVGGLIVSAGVNEVDALFNDGFVDIGGAGSVASSLFLGDVFNLARGEFALDVDSTGMSSDLLVLSGEISFDPGAKLLVQTLPGFLPQKDAMFDLVAASDFSLPDVDVLDILDLPSFDSFFWEPQILEAPIASVLGTHLNISFLREEVDSRIASLFWTEVAGRLVGEAAAAEISDASKLLSQGFDHRLTTNAKVLRLYLRSEPSQIPLPASFVLLASGVVALLGAAVRRRRGITWR